MSNGTSTPGKAPFDPSAFVVMPHEVRAALFPIAATLFDPVTDEFNAERGRELFDEFVSTALMFIFQRQDRMQEMAKLAGLASKDPEAKQGLRKAIVDHVSSRLVSNTEAGTSGQGTIKSDQFQTFIRENANALRVAGFSADEVKNMQAIADDLQRANRSNTAVRLPGQSNTAQDAYKIQQGDAPATILGRILMGAAATGGFASSGATGGLVGIVGAKAASAMRDFGLETVNDIVADAMLHPERARILLQKATPGNQKAVSEIMARNYRKAATSAAIVSTGEQDKAK